MILLYHKDSYYINNKQFIWIHNKILLENPIKLSEVIILQYE